MPHTLRFLLFTPLLFLLHAAAVHADAGPDYNQVSFSVAVSETVDNDLLHAVLYAEREGSDPAILANQVNRGIEWALEEVRREPLVKVQTSGYQTHPVYHKGAIAGWRVTQSISLESGDTAALSALIGRLQQRLAVRQLDFRISDLTRDAAEARLIGRAMAAFSQRAALIAAQLERRDYRIITLNLRTGGGRPPQPMLRSMAMASADAGPTAPSLEAGTQEVTVTVDATVELSVN